MAANGQETQPRAAVSLSAKKSVEFFEADGLENWSIAFDASSLKPGTYNIVARAVDAAGNVAFSSPFNIVIDPDSDLPVAGIVNPLPLARVGADLNIVGTCVDDDGVSHVELRVDDGPWVRAEGGDYWSYYLSTATLSDGLRTLYARGVDVNGVVGKETRVSFHLDRTKPTHTIASPGFGAIVSGRLTISGVVYDANGLSEASYSLDSGASWTPLRYAYDKRSREGRFSLTIDTAKRPDGPSVLWLRSVDGVGSEGNAVFLFFVDNTRPELIVISPTEDEAVNGAFELRGRVGDAVGLRSLSWSLGKAGGEVELLPGNPYFSIPFEAPATAGPLSLRLTALAVAGNATIANVTRRVDPQADLPRVSLSLPAEGGSLEGAILVVGEARDDDGVASIRWRLDDGPEESLETDGPFSLTIADAASGPRTLRVRAVDLHGLAGPWLERRFSFVGAAPRIASLELIDSAGRRPFRPGDALSALEGKASIVGLVEAANPLVRLSYSINGVKEGVLPLPKGKGPSPFTIPIGTDLPFGVLDIRLEAEDAAGKKGVARFPVLSTDYSRPLQGPLLDLGLADEPSGAEPRTLYLRDDEPALGRLILPFEGDRARAVRLEPPSALVSASLEGDIIRLTRLADGLSQPTSIQVETERGHVVRAGPFLLSTDSTGPGVEIVEPAHGAWLSGASILRVRATDADAVALVEYAIDGGAWLPLEATAEGYSADFDAGAPGAAAGVPTPARIDVRARDRAGNRGGAMTAFMSDATPPRLKRLLPRDGDLVSGPTLFAVELGEALGSLASAELLRQGVAEPLTPADVLTFTADASAGALLLRAVDKAGNAAELDLLAGLAVRDSSPPEAPARRARGPLAEGPRLLLAGRDAVGEVTWAAPLAAPTDGAPTDGALGAEEAALRVSGELRVTLTLSGLALDPKKPSAAWSTEAGATPAALTLKKGAEAGSWSVALRLPARPDGPAELRLSLRDLERGELEAVVALDYDSTPPLIEVIAPLAQGGGTANVPADAFAVVVRASDARGIAGLSYELGRERGALEALPGSGDAARLFALPAQAKGGSLVIRAVDGTGNAASATLSLTARAPVALASPAPPEAFSAPRAPRILFTDITRPSGASGPGLLGRLVPGTWAVVDTKSRVSAQAWAPAGLRSVSYAINGGEWKPLSPPKAGPDGSHALSAPLPADLPYGRNLVAFRLTDALGAEASTTTSFYRVAEPRPRGAIVAEGLYRSGEGAELRPAPGLPIDFLFYGRPVASATLEPSVDFASVSVDGSRLSLEASADGRVEALTLRVVTVDGDAFTLGPLAAVSDSSPPTVTITEPQSGTPMAGAFTVSGRASDPNGVVSVEYSSDGGLSWSGAASAPDPAGPPGALAFSASVDPAGPDGTLAVIVRATDASGASTRALSAVRLDRSPPLLRLETPRPVDTVNGIVLMSGRAYDDSSLASLEYSPDGVSWEALVAAPTGAARAADPKRGAEAQEAARSWSFSRLVDLAALPEGGAGLAIRAADAAGNTTTLRPLAPEAMAFTVDIAADRPSIQLQIPAEDEVMRADFIVSGMAFDDDGVAEIRWRLDGGDWSSLGGSNGFSVALRLADLADNEHRFEAYAIDLNGVEGEVAARTFRVSREEPVGRLLSPDISVVNRGVIELGGSASDANGIASVAVSFDHGATYNAVSGTESWRYVLDTRTLPDGIHSVYLRLTDGYGTQGFAAGLLAVDNTPPELSLDVPADGWEGLSRLVIGGRTGDAIGLAETSVTITRLGSDEPERIVTIAGSGVFSESLDLGGLRAGWYNLRVTARDRAGNLSHESRNVTVLESAKADRAEIVFPASGERLSGRFSIDGRVVSAEPVERAQVTVDGRPFATVTLGGGGWFSLPVDGEGLADGEHAFRIEAVSRAGAPIVSEPRTLTYAAEGPWVDIDSLSTGDFVVGRPYLTGKAGWAAASPDPGDRAAMAAHAKLEASRRPVRVEVSRDNGKTYGQASGAAAFRYRLETQEYPSGTLRLTIVATFADGSTATRKRLVVLDTEAPRVAILRPSQNGRYNGVIAVEGTASDQNGLREVSVAFRSGDKASYEVPSFIQGSYLDLHLLGATRLELGLGLTFFDDNVKLQASLGQGFDAQPSWDNLLGYADETTPASLRSRFGGYVLGAKLLANLAYLPFSYFFGPDWDFFSMSFALGASFTYFSMRPELAQLFSPPEGRYMILSGVTGQWEFAKFTLGLPALDSIGLYVEGGFVFIPSEASTRLEEFIRPNLAFGLRIGLF